MKLSAVAAYTAVPAVNPAQPVKAPSNSSGEWPTDTVTLSAEARAHLDGAGVQKVEAVEETRSFERWEASREQPTGNVLDLVGRRGATTDVNDPRRVDF